MSTFVKKATSTVAALAVVFSIVSPIAGVSAAYTSLEAANELSTLGIIVDKSANPADYRLGDNLPRKEGVKVMMNLSSITVENNCAGKFADLPASDWACKYAETALANGMVAGNATFGPDRLLSKVEALKMVFQGRDLERNDNADWRAGYVEAAVEMGVADASFSDYDTPVTRGQFFIWAANAVAADDVAGEDDLLCAILGTCEEEGTDEEGTDEETGTGEVVVVGGDLEVTLSPMSPKATTIPGSSNGLRVAAFDLTAGDSDVTVTQVSLKRVGLGDADTLESIALFTSEGRVSNAKSDNQDNNTTAQINLDNGGLVVKAGKTVTLYAAVDVGASADAAGDEFALEVVNVVSNGDVTMDGRVLGATMKVGSVDAPEIVFSNAGSVTNPNLGAKAADIFKFKIQGDDSEDVVLHSITFEGNSDAEDALMNFELLEGNKVVATTSMMVGDYLTFDIDGGLIIAEDKNLTYTVRADVVAGAGDQIEFDIDAALDVSANSTKFGLGASADISAFGPSAVTVQAGELTFVEVTTIIDEVRADKDNVVLGTFKVSNQGGDDLEMQKFGAVMSLNAGGATIGTGALTLANALEDVELYSVDTGSSYELKISTVSGDTVFADNKIDVVLPEGTSTWAIRADTAENITNFANARFTISLNVSRDIKVVELADDEEVTDKTPSSLTFKTIKGATSGAQVNLLPLANTDVVRGSSNTEALKFEVKAGKSSPIVVDEMTVQVMKNSAVATKQQVSEVKLYKNTISDANLLDSEGNITTNGEAVFDRMGDVAIAANETQVFIVTVSFVDSTDAVSGGTYVARLTDISIEDDEQDDITVTTLPVISARAITVNEAGSLVTLSLDGANEDNEFDKLALAGNSTVIASWDVRANNEEVDVETVTFAIAGASGSLQNSVVSASLLLDGKVVFTNRNADILNNEIRFVDVTGLIIPETTTELALQLNTASIGKDKVGQVQTGLTVTAVTLSDAEGAESGKVVTSLSNTTQTSKTLDIVKAVVTPAVVSTFGTDDLNAELRLVVDGGSNTKASGDTVQAELTALTFEATSVTGTGVLTVFNGNGAIVGTGAVNGSGDVGVTITVTPESIGSNNEVYRIETTAKGSFRLKTNGVTYTVDNTTVSTKLENTLNLGQYNTSN